MILKITNLVLVHLSGAGSSLQQQVDHLPAAVVGRHVQRGGARHVLGLDLTCDHPLVSAREIIKK